MVRVPWTLIPVVVTCSVQSAELYNVQLGARYSELVRAAVPFVPAVDTVLCDRRRDCRRRGCYGTTRRTGDCRLFGRRSMLHPSCRTARYELPLPRTLRMDLAGDAAQTGSGRRPQAGRPPAQRESLPPERIAIPGVAARNYMVSNLSPRHLLSLHGRAPSAYLPANSSRARGAIRRPKTHFRFKPHPIHCNAWNPRSPVWCTSVNLRN